MSIDAKWFTDEKKLIIRTFEGRWTWEEFYADHETVKEMLLSVEHVVDQIFDFTQTNSLPPNTLTHLAHIGSNMPPNRGKSIVVIKNNFYERMYNILSQLFPSVTERVVIVSTLEEAFEAYKNPKMSEE